MTNNTGEAMIFSARSDREASITIEGEPEGSEYRKKYVASKGVAVVTPITVDLIFPVYNEANRLKLAITALNSFTSPPHLKINRIIFVNDGSTDQSLAILRRLRLKYPTKIISYPLNRGKGFAIKQGLLAAKADYALFLDVDMSTPLTEIKKFLPYFKSKTPVIIGTRKNGHSTVTIHQPKYRELMGRVFTFLSNLILNTWVTDFTCGFKAFSCPAYLTLAPLMTINRWGFDSELLFLSRLLGYHIQEKALTWADQPQTRVNLLKDIYRSLAELFQIRLNHLRGRYSRTPRLADRNQPDTPAVPLLSPASPC